MILRLDLLLQNDLGMKANLATHKKIYWGNFCIQVQCRNMRQKASFQFNLFHFCSNQSPRQNMISDKKLYFWNGFYFCNIAADGSGTDCVLYIKMFNLSFNIILRDVNSHNEKGNE